MAIVTGRFGFLAILVLGMAQPTPAAESEAEATFPPFGEESKYLANITQLTSESMGLANAGEAYFSPDARMIIFQATPVGKDDYQIYTLELATRKLKMVSTGKGACTCAFFHPNGKRIIFASTHLDPNLGQARAVEDGDDYRWQFDAAMDIFEANVDGSNLRRLTSAPGYDAEATYSPDGKSIVFTSNRDGDLELYLMDADSGNPRRMTYGKGYDGGAFFSPDMKTLLYRGDRRFDGKMNLQIRMIDSNGNNDRALTDNPIFNWCPFWYPTGKAFIFTQADHRGRPNYDLIMATANAKNFTRITFDTRFDGLAVFSPDGKKLLWTSKRGGGDSQIFIADFSLPDIFR
ncbi:MAG: hypothetical protein ACE5E5_03675 [Phycisphaerae bacterium]